MKGKKGFQKGSDHWNWSGKDASYFARHDRCIKARGKASEHECIRCAEDGINRLARDWALIHGESGLDPWADFVALCRSCHLRYDYTDERRQKKSHTLTGKPWSPARRAAEEARRIDPSDRRRTIR